MCCQRQVGEGNVTIHSQKKRRYKCSVCGKTFSQTTGTALYGLKKSAELFVTVVTLLAYGCPVQAIVMAFGLDDETVRAWLKKSGKHGQQMHEYYMAQTALDLGQVQADEIKVKKQRGSVWMALALIVSTRLWLGGVVGVNRDKFLIGALARAGSAVGAVPPAPAGGGRVRGLCQGLSRGFSLAVQRWQRRTPPAVCLEGSSDGAGHQTTHPRHAQH